MSDLIEIFPLSQVSLVQIYGGVALLGVVVEVGYLHLA